MPEQALTESGTPLVVEISDHVVGFYVGRGLTGAIPVPLPEDNWVNRGSWSLGAATYAVHEGDRAIVYDTMALPSLGAWVRAYLELQLGIRRFTVVLSHWHLDHIAGLPSYADSSIVSLELTREALLRHRTGIESGSVWGPPALQVMLPDITFEDRLDLHLKNLKVELHRFEIHSRDGNLMYIPDDRVLFAGDALEDTLTYVEEPDGISTHLAELDRLRAMDIDAVYPNHGDFEIISAGGYPKALIDAVAEYDANMLTRVHDADYLEMPIEDFIPDALAAGVVTVWEPYRAVHARNLRLVSGCKDSTVR